MTAMSAQRASEPDPAANHFAAVDIAAPIRLPGNDRTYEVRDVLRGLGLRWDPKGHAWHGSLPATERELLEQRYGLVPRPVRAIESFQEPPAAEPKAPAESFSPRWVTRDSFRTSPLGSSPRGNLTRVPSARTRFESRLAFGATEEDDADEVETETRRFSLFETASGLPDDSREEDERQAERHLRDLRGRVKAARAAISSTPAVAEVLRQDWKREAHFLARFGLTQAQFHHGVPSQDAGPGWDFELGHYTCPDPWASREP